MSQEQPALQAQFLQGPVFLSLMPEESSLGRSPASCTRLPYGSPEATPVPAQRVPAAEALPEEPDSEQAPAKPEPEGWRARLKGMVKSSGFEIVLGVFIVMNATLMAAQCQYVGLSNAHLIDFNGDSRPADEIWPQAEEAINIAELFFGALVTAELILKMVVLRMDFVRDGWNWFDFIIVSAWLVETSNVLAFGLDLHSTLLAPPKTLDGTA